MHQLCGIRSARQRVCLLEKQNGSSDKSTVSQVTKCCIPEHLAWGCFFSFNWNAMMSKCVKVNLVDCPAGVHTTQCLAAAYLMLGNKTQKQKRIINDFFCYL